MNKKLYTLVAALLSLSLLTACTTNNTETKDESMMETEMETPIESNMESDSENEGEDEVYKFEANITEINENKLTVSLNNNGNEGNSGDPLIVIIPTENNYDLKVGDNIEVEYDGIMMTSYPGQVFASNITVLDRSGSDTRNSDDESAYKFNATVVEMADNSLTVTPDPESEEGKGNEKIIVNFPEDASYDIKNGDTIEIEYNGMMTRSIPPQISATNITLVDNAE